MEIQNNKSEAQQIKEILLFWLKYWYYFVISIAVCGIIGLIYLKTATPVINVVAQVSLRHDESLLGGGMSKNQSLMSAFGLGRGSENIEDETLKMSSQGYIKKVAKNLELNKVYIQKEFLGLIKTNLYDLSPVTLSVDPSIADTITTSLLFSLNIKPDKTKVKIKAGKVTLGKYEITSYPATFKTPFGDFTLEKSACYDLYDIPLNLDITYTGYDYITQNYRAVLIVDFEKKTSDLINMEMATKDVPFAKKVLNEIIRIYNEEWDKDKGLVSEKTIGFIEERLASVEVLLADADKDIQHFKDKYNLTEIEADVTYYLTLSGELQAKILEAETRVSIIDIIVQYVKDERNKYALIPFNLPVDDSSVSLIIEKYNEALMKRNDLYKSNTQGSLARSLDEQLEAQRKNLLVSLENIKEGARIALSNLKKKDKEFNSKIGKVPVIEKDYVHLRRNQEIQQTIYIFLLQMREETGVKGISLLPKLKVIDPPYAINKPLAPNKIKTMFLVIFIGGIFIPLSAIYSIPSIQNIIRKRKEE